MARFGLANIIQGEAATPAGQFAVASTIQNRINSGLSFGGVIGGSGADQANAPGQFVGHLLGAGGPGAVPSTVSPSAQTFADAIDNGNLSDYGDPGNALFFQSNQGQPSTVVGGASANIGGNFFSDRFGQPSADFVPPAYGGSLDATVYDPNSSMFDNQSLIGAGSPATSFGDGTTNPALASNSGALFNGSIWGTGSPGGGDGNNIADNGNDPLGSSVTVAGGQGASAPTMGVTGDLSDAGIGTSGSATSGSPGMSAVPGAQALQDGVKGVVNVTGDFLSTGSQAISKAANAVTGGLSGAATTVGQTITSAVDSLEKNATSWLTRWAVFVLAIVLLFGAIVIIAMSNRQPTVVLPVPA